MRTIISGIMATFAMLVSSCATLDDTATGESVANENLGVALLYQETESGGDPSMVSVFVNKKFIRIDDQQFPNDFILFDRTTLTINNVVSAEKAVYVIAPNSVNEAPPVAINYTEEKQESAAIGRGSDTAKGFHYRFFANGTLCYNVVVAENFLPDVVAALKEFRQTLAGEHIRSVGRLPAERIDACDLALNVFYPTHHLDFGFPVREWDPNGYSKFLKDVKQGVAVDPGYTQLPKGYKEYPFGEKAPPLKGG